MYPNVFLRTKRGKQFPQGTSTQSGSMLVMALFVLIILSLLAATMINIISASSNNVLHEVYGLRADLAAQAGIESLLASSFPVGGAPQACSVTITNDLSLTNIAGFRNCNYSASCLTETISYNGESYSYYSYSSTGTCDSGVGIVSRTLGLNAMEQNP